MRKCHIWLPFFHSSPGTCLESAFLLISPNGLTLKISKELPWKGRGDAKKRETRNKVNNHGGQQVVTRGEVNIEGSGTLNV